jgi:ABC-type branched-subunit amino acid transport system permease subunit
MAFVIGSLFAGLVGLLAVFFHANPDDFTTTPLYVDVCGNRGTQTVLGPIMGCLILLSSRNTRLLKQYMPIILGMILILVLLFCPVADNLTGKNTFPFIRVNLIKGDQTFAH